MANNPEVSRALDKIKRLRRFLNLDSIEGAAGIPYGTLSKALDKVRGFPAKHNDKLIAWFDAYLK